MAGMAGVVVPNYSHHVIQRVNQWQNALFCEDNNRYILTICLSSQGNQGPNYGVLA